MYIEGKGRNKTDMKREFPILEYDDNTQALLNPQKNVKPIESLPPHCVICFFQDVLNHLNKSKLLTKVYDLKSEMGTHPVYTFDYNGRPVVIFHPGVGAPFAAGLLEEVIVLGCNKFIACGGAGILEKDIAVGHLLIPTSAIRDEGTSYHYLPPSREIKTHPDAVAAMEKTLQNKKVPYQLVKTWTIDALYRETPDKIELRKSEGCTCVEMETAALFAVAEFRNVKLGQLLYAGDDLSGEYWDGRQWASRWDVREKLVYLAAESCLAMD